MQLPDFPEVSASTLQMIAEQHHLGAHTFSRFPLMGIFNFVQRVFCTAIRRRRIFWSIQGRLTTFQHAQGATAAPLMGRAAPRLHP